MSTDYGIRKFNEGDSQFFFSNVESIVIPAGWTCGDRRPWSFIELSRLNKKLSQLNQANRASLRDGSRAATNIEFCIQVIEVPFHRRK